MVFFGSTSKHLKSERVTGPKCKHCKNQAPVNISIYGKYAHIYWIPFFPMGKTGVSECTHCKITLAPGDMDEPLKRKYNEVNSKTKTPIWYWSVLFLIVGIIGLSIFVAGNHKNDVVTYIENPMAGDIYEFEYDGDYSTLKVTEVTTDSIFVIANSYVIGKSSRIYKIDKPENYTGESYGFGKNELKGMYDDKKITDITRD